MGERFWIRLWNQECERTKFFISTTIAEGIVITLLVGALTAMLALR